MATSRRLQLDIERCLKKVAEGVEAFDIAWDRVHESRANEHDSQFKRYSLDLRKELKRLRRLREQVRSWIASDEVKDKTCLNDTRRLIESKMECYESYEKVAKRKMFSTDALKNKESLTPVAKERIEMNDWLVASIDALGLQLDQFECEVESLLLGKKKPAKACVNKVADLKLFQEKHNYHIKKLEMLLRMFNNMSVSISEIHGIKDYVDYYIQSSQEPEFQEIVNIYDDIVEIEESAVCGVDVLFPPKSDDGSSKSSIDLNADMSLTMHLQEGDHGKSPTESKESKGDMAMGDCNSRRNKTSFKTEKALSKSICGPTRDSTSPTISPRLLYKRSKQGPDASSHAPKANRKNVTISPTSSVSQPSASINVWKIEKPIINSDLDNNLKKSHSTDELANPTSSDKLSEQSSPINKSDFPCIGQYVVTKSPTKVTKVPSPTNKTWSAVLCQSSTQCPANAHVVRPLESPEEKAPIPSRIKQDSTKQSDVRKKSRAREKSPEPTLDPKDGRALALEWFYKDYFRFNHLTLNPIEEEIFQQSSRSFPLRTKEKDNFNIFDESNNMEHAVFVDQVFKKPDVEFGMQYGMNDKYDSMYNSLKPVDLSYFEMGPTPSLLAEPLHCNVDTRPLLKSHVRQLAHLEAAFQHRPEAMDSVRHCNVDTSPLRKSHAQQLAHLKAAFQHRPEEMDSAPIAPSDFSTFWN